MFRLVECVTIDFPCRFSFPFGRPEGALKATLSLLERVLMKDIVTPVPPEEVRVMIKKSLETAALVNYTRLSGEAKIEGKIPSKYFPLKLLNELRERRSQTGSAVVIK